MNIYVDILGNCEGWRRYLDTYIIVSFFLFVFNLLLAGKFKFTVKMKSENCIIYNVRNSSVFKMLFCFDDESDESRRYFQGIIALYITEAIKWILCFIEFHVPIECRESSIFLRLKFEIQRMIMRFNRKERRSTLWYYVFIIPVNSRCNHGLKKNIYAWPPILLRARQ